MNVLIVYAHPEEGSLNGSLKNFAVKRLEGASHDVQVSDLYAMKWKAGLDAEDATEKPPGQRFYPSLDSKKAFEAGTQPEDIAREQDKLLWADAVILQFPMWWFSMPAILKGWVDRVYAYGFGYGVGEHSERHWGDRYGEGTLVGRRAMLIVTTGGWEPHYSPRGINGPIDDILFPIQHGILHYPGFEVLPPFVLYSAGKVDEPGFTAACEKLGQRLDDLWRTEPIRFRRQNGGDYNVPELTLRSDIAAGQSGLGIHIAPEPSTPRREDSSLPLYGVADEFG